MSRAHSSWLVLGLAILAVVMLLDEAPSDQLLELRLGPHHRLDFVSVSCVQGQYHSGATWNLDAGSKRDQLRHRFLGSAGEYHCEILLKRFQFARQVHRTVEFSGHPVTVPLEHELAKMGR